MRNTDTIDLSWAVNKVNDIPDPEGDLSEASLSNVVVEEI